MISAIKLKKRMAGASVFGIIVNKLYYGKKLCLIILLKIDKNLEIGFYCTILPLNLATHLQVESDKEFLLNTKRIA